MERSSSTFLQSYTFFSQISGLAETILTWEAKGVAEADANSDAETNLKHKVIPHRDDLINSKIDTP